MTDTERLDAIENAASVSRARRLLEGALDGFEPMLFERLRHVIGADQRAAKHLAEVGKALEGSWGERFRAVGLRIEHRWLASANAYLKAESLAKDPVDGASMAIGAIDSLARGGRVGRAIAQADRLIAILEKANRNTDAGRAALNAGNALLWNDRIEEAAPFFERAIKDLADSPIERAGAWLGISTVQIDFGTATLVRKPAERALDTFESLGLRTYAMVAEQNIAQADIMAGKFDTALQRLLRLRHELDRGSEEFARNEQHIGETYLRLNMPVEACQAYQDALASRAMARLPYNKAQCNLGLAEANIAIGDDSSATEAARAAKLSFRRLGNSAGVALAQSFIVEASSDTDHSELHQASEALARCSLRRRTAEMLLTLSERAQDRTALSKGRKIVHRHGLIDLEWRVHAANARTTQPKRRIEAYRKMAKAMWQARSVYQSTIARQHFLRNKDEALREYLGELLADPSRENVREALDVVGQARSIALIDEILGARRGHLTQSESRHLEEIRESIREEVYRQEPTDGARRSRPIELDNWRRAWREAEGLLLSASHHGRSAAADLTFVLANDRYYSVANDNATDIGLRQAIEKSIRWLTFDLLEPIVNPGADPNRVIEPAKSLAADLLVSGAKTILPDEGLWHVPWPLVCDNEPILSIAPGFSRLYRPAKVPESVIVWYQPSDALPHIRREVDLIAGMFPDTMLCSSLAEVRDSLARGSVDLLHVATHAALNPWNPMFSYLQFEDGRLFAAEIARGGLRPKLVTMSACEAGSVSTVNSNEPDGLVRAALALGAESVVASAWPLDDCASAEFTRPYYQSLRELHDVKEAVRRGRSAVRDRHEHPYYWAPMVVFGGYDSQ